MKQPAQWQINIVLFFGIAGASSAAIWVRMANSVVTVDSRVGFSLFLAASRLILSALIVLPTWKQLSFAQINQKSFYYAIASGVTLALHFATWITSLAYTSIAASTVLVTTSPIWVGILSWWWYKEKLSRLKITGMVIALIGGMIIAIADSHTPNSYSNALLGDLLAIVGAVMSSLYLIFGSQAQNQGLSINNYITISYSTAAILLFPLPLVYGSSYIGYNSPVYLYVLLMAVVSQVIGHTSLNWAVKWVSPALISLSLLFEPVLASFIAAILWQEIPSPNILLGGLIILLGIGVFVQKK